MNSAANIGAPPGPARDIGNSNRTVPTATAMKNAIGTIRAGCRIGWGTGDLNRHGLGRR
jgi:hypothetical protein